MRATAKLLALITAAGLCGPQLSALAGVPGAAGLLAGGVMWGQLTPARPAYPSTDAGSFSPANYEQAPPASAAIPGDARARSDASLKQARQALADGDVRRAAQLAQQAERQGATFQLHEDSPAKVQALIQKHSRFVVGPPPGADTQLFHRQYAQYLMDQADGLLNAKDFARAQQLAEQAAQLGAEYGQFERTPQKMMQQIAAARQGAGGAPAELDAAAHAHLKPIRPAGQQTAAAGRWQQAKAEAQRLIARGQAALDANDLVAAKRLAEQARALNVPDTEFEPGDVRPWELQLQINQAMSLQPVVQAGGQAPAATPVQQGIFHSGADDGSHNRQVQGESYGSGGLTPLRTESSVLRSATTGGGFNVPATSGVGPAIMPRVAAMSGAESDGEELYRLGIQALSAGNRQQALEHFRAAWQFEGQLDPPIRAQLKDKLSLLQQGPPNPLPEGQRPTPIEQLSTEQQIALQALKSQIQGETRAAAQQRETDPKGALNRLQRLRSTVGAAELDPPTIKQLKTLVDRQIADLERYIELNRSTIELDERNRMVRQSIAEDRERLVQVQDKVAELVDNFNTLLDEQRFDEAEVLAKQANELAPELPVVEMMQWKSRFARQMAANLTNDEARQLGFLEAMNSVEQSSRPFNDMEPISFNGARRWVELSRKRRRLMANQGRRYTDEEMQIERNLKSKVDVKFDNAPLSHVIDTLCQMANVPVYIDNRGLQLEAVTTDQPVTIDISQPIMLKSALNLILQELGLSYVIENEVLKITTADVKDQNVYQEVYNVADLVIPIPNFMPSYDIGLPSAIREAHAAIGYGGSVRPISSPQPFMLSSNEQAPQGPSFLSQMSRMPGILPGSSTRPSQPMGAGPGGLGGAAMADFDTLIELITTTIAPDSWEELGGPGAIESFPTNLSLVVSQTQDVHEQITDLLDQLRRLQDLQITIEVRFITLSDNWFERIGIDLDFDIDDNSLLGNGTPVSLYPDDIGPSVTFGLDPDGNPTADLDFQFRQDSFGSSTPQFGGFDPATAANFGFAILSDIEVFFLLQAATGDQRSNVLQAPKVTLFNGQSASVSDTSQRPFVTSIIPVVGDFAAAQQPVITVLSEGTSLSVQGVISSDRRFVRLTLVPFFSQIGDVDTFTFEGAQTSDTGTQILDAEGNPTGVTNNTINARSGSTVQLPTFSFTTVSTTVSVPDGGTVLLGGIKRLREGRTERGVPILSKVPYINRLFKNVGIGRDAQSLMLMVTPRIIIKEEEEENIGVSPGA